MGTFTTDCLEQTAGRSGEHPQLPLILVVGFDGSGPATHALERAADLVSHRDGELEVVFVAHTPAAAEMSGGALVQVRQGLDDLAKELATDVRTRLGHRPVRWHFQRRDGAVAPQLQAVAAELAERYNGNADIVIVTGGSEHWYHHLAGSIGVSLARHDRFPLIVVP